VRGWPSPRSPPDGIILVEQNHRLCCHKPEAKNHQTTKLMRKLKLTIALLAGLAFAGAAVTALADDSATKETSITGNMVCAKCTLHETKECQNVVQVVLDGKTINYYLEQNDVSKAAHDPICGGSSEKVTVTGIVKETDGKKTMTPSKIDVIKS
jgi:hypothetical protein